MSDAPGPDFVQSLARGLAVIRTFDEDHPALSLSEIARRAGISPAAARRFLHTLVALGYVRQEGRLFSLTPQVLELGFSYLSALSFPDVVQPHLEALSQDVDESVSAAVLAGDEIVYVARVSPRRIMTVGITIGTRFSSYVTSMGRVLLANLEPVELDAVLEGSGRSALAPELRRVREQGWALVDSELEPGLCSIAVPIHQPSVGVQSAINVSTTTSRHTPEWVKREFLPKLQQTAIAIEADLKHTGPR